jgi:D-alanine--D-alanine ligase
MNSSVTILFGGNSPEKGISINSARSLLDHLREQCQRVNVIFFDDHNRPFLLSANSLYSNTPLDFAFKISTIGQSLNTKKFRAILRQSSLTIPAVHGRFGEGGELQRLLECLDVPYVGTRSDQARVAFDKYSANKKMAAAGLRTFPAMLLQHGQESKSAVTAFFHEHGPEIVVKPTHSGSSIGVHVVDTITAIHKAAQSIFDSDPHSCVILEPYCRGSEFTVVVLQNDKDLPVALCPIEVRLNRKSQWIHDYRTKYLPSEDSSYLIPPTFSDAEICRIRDQASRVFSLFGLRDVARLDGWLLPSGEVIFNDINIASGLEQNSFLFIEAAALGLTHSDTIRYLLTCAARRHGVAIELLPLEYERRKRVYVIFGGSTAEANVSVMSGTNVWLKLQHSARYEPIACFLDEKQTVWTLPYYMYLFHTVREITYYAENADSIERRLAPFRKQILRELGDSVVNSCSKFSIEKHSLDDFICRADLVFIALHGGFGENGALQSKLEGSLVSFTGSGSATSRVCMDKLVTAERVKAMAFEGVSALEKFPLSPSDFPTCDIECRNLWMRLMSFFKRPAAGLIVKPRADGCSAGVARICCYDDLHAYLLAVIECADRIEPRTLSKEDRIIELPRPPATDLVFEQFIETIEIALTSDGQLTWNKQAEWIELTSGLLSINGALCVLPPSVILANKKILSLEEKFQGGTGVNITPPPQTLVNADIIHSLSDRLARIAKYLGIDGFARIDLFLNRTSGEMILIEVNTIPALTPSTVFFQQALASEPALLPVQVLENILECAENSKRGNTEAVNQMQGEKSSAPFRADYVNLDGSRVEGDATDAEGNGGSQ